MTLPELCIRRPVMTTLLMAALLIFGIIGYRALPVSDLPSVDFPTISVSASLPGASPETMASSVAAPLERQFSTIAGLDNMSSTSALGATSITLQFALDRNIDGAAQDVQAAIAATLRNLPAEMPAPPSYRKVNPAESPIMYLAVESSVLPLSQVDEYAESMIAERLSTVPGVAQVMVYGSQKYAVRINVSPEALASRGIAMSDVANAIAQGNPSIATGVLDGPQQSYTIQTNSALNDAAQYKPLVVAWRNGAPVRLDQIGQVIDSVENDKVASWYRQTRAIVLAIQRQPGTNTVAIADAIHKLLPSFESRLPGAVKMKVLFDRSQSIRASIDDVQFTLILATGLVLLVIFLFLRTASATIIPSLAMPLSVISTFGGMYLLGYSLNNLSLMALTLSVGFVVDDAIVMLENIVRHMEEGDPPMQAALKGAREIGFTIISMTLSLVAVFIPVLFMGGVLGRLLHEFAVTICMAVLVSGFVSLTLTPMLGSRFVKPPAQAHHGRLYQWSEGIFNAWRDLYMHSLEVVLRHRFATLMVALGTLVVAGLLFVVTPKGFLPSEDTGAIFGMTEANPDISFAAMSKLQQKVAAVIAADPDVHGFMSAVGSGGSSRTGNTGRVFIHLKDRSQRKHSVDQVIQALRPKLAQIPGIKVFLQNPPAIRLGGHLTKSLYQYTLQGPDLTALYHWASLLEDKLKTLPDLQEVTSDMQITSLQAQVDIDRDRAAALGITAQQIDEALSYAYGTRQVSTIYTPSNDYQVILGVEPKDQQEPGQLALLYLRAASGKLVPLQALVHVTRGTGPLTVNHQGQLPAVTLSFNLSPGAALGNAVTDLTQAERAIGMPASITGSFQGSAQVFQQSMKGLGLLLLVAVLVIYIVLGILYESFIHPLTILSGLPSAAVGALLTLLLLRMELSVTAFVGVIMLVGIVKKNAIMMIDFAINAERKEGKASYDAIVEACRLRFRPIMMTTVAALMGTLPIALGIGAGAESRQPLGVTVVGGLLLSQFLTLYITPVVYLYLDRFTRHKAEPALQSAV